MAAGDLVGDDLAEAVTAQRLAEHDWNYGFVIDGFPRNIRQAEFFLESYDIDGVIHLDMPDSEVRLGPGAPSVLELRDGLQPHPGPPAGGGRLRRLRRHPGHP